MHLIREWLWIIQLIACEYCLANDLPERPTTKDRTRRRRGIRLWKPTNAPTSDDHLQYNPKESDTGSNQSKDPGDPLTEGSCHSHFVPARGIIPFIRRHLRLGPKHERLRRPRLAYKMALLANLAYWQFHLWKDEATNLPITGGFRLKYARRQKRIFPMLQLLRTKLLLFFSSSNPILLYPLDARQRGHQSIGKLPMSDSSDNNGSESKRPSNEQWVDDGEVFSFEYSLYNWHERTIPGVSFHDTDILIATSNRGKLIVSFAGTSSTADAVTNIQTFEFANHSSLFHGGKPGVENVEGSIHRGFLNAYSRVHQGGVVRLADYPLGCTDSGVLWTNESRHSLKGQWELVEPLHNRYCHCVDRSQKSSSTKRLKKKFSWQWWRGMTSRRNGDILGMRNLTSMTDEEIEFFTNDQNTMSHGSKQGRSLRVKKRKSGGCFSRGEKLVDILRDLVTNALTRGAEVYFVGHSLGGGVASLAALDVVVNFPKVPVSRLALYTFGAPQVVDDIFLQSCMKLATRLSKFVHSKKHFHRFTTISDDCRVDIVVNVTKRALASHKQNLRGRFSRKLGGVHGHVVHFSEPPYYLVTESQYHRQNKWRNRKLVKRFRSDKKQHAQLYLDDEAEDTMTNSSTKTSVAAHQLRNYLEGISRESKHHPLLVEMDERISKFVFNN